MSLGWTRLVGSEARNWKTFPEIGAKCTIGDPWGKQTAGHTCKTSCGLWKREDRKEKHALDVSGWSQGVCKTQMDAELKGGELPVDLRWNNFLWQPQENNFVPKFRKQIMYGELRQWLCEVSSRLVSCSNLATSSFMLRAQVDQHCQCRWMIEYSVLSPYYGVPTDFYQLYLCQ